MMFFPVLGILFLVAAAYNLVQRDYKNMTGTLVFAAALFAIYFARRSKAAADVAAISQQDGGRQRCCRCGSDQGVSQRAYLLTYSLVFFTSKSAGAFRPICRQIVPTGGSGGCPDLSHHQVDWPKCPQPPRLPLSVRP